MPTVNLTIEQLLEAVKQLSPVEMKRVEAELRQRLLESEEEAHHSFVAAAIEATDWWDDEGDKEWDRWHLN